MSILSDRWRAASPLLATGQVASSAGIYNVDPVHHRVRYTSPHMFNTLIYLKTIRRYWSHWRCYRLRGRLCWNIDITITRRYIRSILRTVLHSTSKMRIVSVNPLRVFRHEVRDSRLRFMDRGSYCCGEFPRWILYFEHEDMLIQGIYFPWNMSYISWNRRKVPFRALLFLEIPGKSGSPRSPLPNPFLWGSFQATLAVAFSLKY